MRGPEVPVAATGLLRAFAEAGMIHVADFHLARRMAAYCGESDDRVLLALALTVRELRLGSVCLDLACAPELIVPGEADDGSVVEPVELPWPEPHAWATAVAASPAVAGPGTGSRPFRLADGLLYLDRFFTEEQELAARLRHRSALPDLPSPEPPAPGPGMVPDPTQDAAVRAATRARTSVITGGPGSGKTTVVSRIIDALATRGPATVALTAPTGKAATRLETAVRDRLRHPERVALTAGTLHRIIGVVPGRAERTHDALNPLPFNVVIVDETSMVSITLMSWLLEAVADSTRLVLIGDPNQLASVEAGAVLADISAAPDLVTSPTTWPGWPTPSATATRTAAWRCWNDRRRARSPHTAAPSRSPTCLRWPPTSRPPPAMPGAPRWQVTATGPCGPWSSTGCCARTGRGPSAPGTGSRRCAGTWLRRCPVTHLRSASTRGNH